MTAGRGLSSRLATLPAFIMRIGQHNADHGALRHGQPIDRSTIEAHEKRREEQDGTAIPTAARRGECGGSTSRKGSRA